MKNNGRNTVQVIIHIKKPYPSKREYRIIKASDAQFQAEIAKIYKKSERIKRMNQDLVNYQHKCLLRDDE